MGESSPLPLEPTPRAGNPAFSAINLFFRWLRGWWLLPLWIVALYVSTHQAVEAALASVIFLQDQELKLILKGPQTIVLDGQRYIQKHYLSFGIYIPLEDIVIRGMVPEPTIVPLLELSCGEGQAYVWVPLRFQLPVLGEKVLEWCLVKA